MKKLTINPLNLPYRYQFKKTPAGNFAYREAADPTMVVHNGQYLLFASMSGGFWYSEDLLEWTFKATPELPIYDYAPDVRQVGGAVVFSASKRSEPCSLYRSEDPIHQPFTPVSTPFTFWDPDIFEDEDGRVYLYWGCTNTDPLYGVELDKDSLMPIGETVALFGENEAVHGWERSGENNKLAEPKTDMERTIRAKLGTKPFIEGAFMTKHNGIYYMQYAAPATECNVYGDGVYTAKSPLGPFTYQCHNPFSSKPGGFIRAAGHGSTFEDKQGNWWHVSSMCIGVNEGFERRLGLFPCEFDEDGILWCNQHFADYPFKLPMGVRTDMRRTAPELSLLSYKKPVTATSHQAGFEPELACDETARTWWAADPADAHPALTLDLGRVMDVHAVQLNFADHQVAFPDLPDEAFLAEDFGARHIWLKPLSLRYLLTASADGEAWQVIKDARQTEDDCPHDFIELDTPKQLRYLRVSDIQMPMHSAPAISGLRVFGYGGGAKPMAVDHVSIDRTQARNILLKWAAADGADGYNVRYGIAANKLYSSWQLNGQTQLDLSMVNGDTDYYIAIDSFNENGVSSGEVHFVKSPIV